MLGVWLGSESEEVVVGASHGGCAGVVPLPSGWGAGGAGRLRGRDEEVSPEQAALAARWVRCGVWGGSAALADLGGMGGAVGEDRPAGVEGGGGGEVGCGGVGGRERHGRAGGRE